MWKRNLTHTLPGFVDTDLLRTLAVSHGDGGVVLPAGWLGVKATQSYWRQVWVRRWLTKPNHMGECCLGHLTSRPFAVCVYLCIRLLIHIFAFVRACWVNSGWGQLGLELIALNGAEGEVPGLDGGTSDWSWSWMRGGWGVECLIQILMGTASHSRRRYSIHWTPSIP